MNKEKERKRRVRLQRQMYRLQTALAMHATALDRAEGDVEGTRELVVLAARNLRKTLRKIK